MSITLTRRDLEIFATLWSTRYMNAPQIQRLFWRESRGGTFGQLKACQRRLRLLTQHKLLRRIDLPVRRGEAPPPYIYTLDKGGAEVLSQELGVSFEEINWRPTDAEENDIFLLHHLATNEVRIAITLACEQTGYTLDTWLDEKELRSEGMYDHVVLTGPQGREERIAVIPDGFFVLHSDKRIARFCLEVDRGTVTVQPTLLERRGWRQKITAYLAYEASGAYSQRYQSKTLWVLTVTTGERRLRHMKEVTEAVGGDHRFWFTTFEQLRPETILTEKIWYYAGSNEPHALLE